MRSAEAIFFLTLAAVVHIGIWSFAPVSLGASSEGGAELSQLTLTSAAAPYNAMARSWKTAPQTALEVVQPQLPTTWAGQPTSNAVPSGLTQSHLPSIVSAPLPITKPPPQPQFARPDTTAQIDTRLPAPPTKRTSTANARPATANARPGIKPEPRIIEPPRTTVPAQSVASGPATKTRQSGHSGQDATQSVNAATRDSLRARWGAKIQRRVRRRLIYPRGATGTSMARVALTISRSGKLIKLRLIRSSGVAVFDQAALKAVRRAGQFPKAPSALRDQSYSFTLSLSFR